MFQLRNKFLLFGGLGFIVFGIYFVYVGYSHDQSNLKRAGERENIILAGFLSNLLENELQQYYLSSLHKPAQLHSSELYQQVEYKIKKIKSNHHSILKVKIFGLGGMTLYSTIEKEIGVLKQNDKPIQNAKSGITTSKKVYKESFMSLKGKLSNRHIVETYIPVYRDNKIIAIFELYSDITDDVKESNRQLFIYQSILLSGAISLFIFLLLLARTADSVIEDQYDKLDKANQNLESKVTERTNDLKLALHEAEKANELKSAFLANMSHELRTPMHAILSFADLASKRMTDEKVSRYLENIKTSGIRLTGLLNALLDISKLESENSDINFKKSNLTQITRQCINELKSLYKEKSLHVLFDGSNDVTGEFDPVLISQVIINLLSNAIKFTPRNGTVQIRLSSVDKDRDEIFTGVMELEISDEGVGIPENELSTVFDKFVQSSKTKSKAGGTGLGLSICKEIINAHKGLIWAESPVTKEGTGSSFHFIIPTQQVSTD